MSDNKKKNVALTSQGDYVITAPKIGKNGLCTVWYKKTGKKYEMHSVDAKEALISGDYLAYDPEGASDIEDPKGEPTTPDDVKNIWKDAEGLLLPMTDETSTKEGLLEALIAESQQVRSNNSKAEILEQWNDYVKETMSAD